MTMSMTNLLSAAKLQKKMHIRKSMSKKVDFCLEVREGCDLLRVHNGFIGYLDFPVITPLPLAEDKPKISPPFREIYGRSMGQLWVFGGFCASSLILAWVFWAFRVF